MEDFAQSLGNEKLELISGSVITIGADLFTDATRTTALGSGDIIITSLDRNADTYDDLIRFEVGDVYNAVGGSAADNQIVVNVTARAVDDRNNTGDAPGDSEVVQNAAQMRIDDPDSSGRLAVTSGTVVSEIVEPDLSVTRQFLTPGGAPLTLADAGQTVAVRMTLTNAGGGDAYEVKLEDSLDPAEFDLSTIDFGTAGVDYPAGFTPSVDLVTGRVIFSGGDVAAADWNGGSVRNEVVTFNFEVDLVDNATPGNISTGLSTIRSHQSLPTGHPDEAHAGRMLTAMTSTTMPSWMIPIH